jgi:phosphoglycerol transferase MdoB-like AlkP superfamily enzyme
MSIHRWFIAGSCLSSRLISMFFTTPALHERRRSLRLVARRHGGVALFLAVFLAVALVARVALLVQARQDVSWNASLLAAFGWGALYDLGAAAWVSLPLTVLLAALPERFFESAWGRRLAVAGAFAGFYALLFGAVAEWTFWEEFGVRFNFIAVDYLVYTTEVIGNIRESYNLPAILGGVAAGAALGVWLLVRSGWLHRWLAAATEPAGLRWQAAAVWFCAAIVFGSVLNERLLPGFGNNFNREIGKNGLWALVAAFKNNILDYEQFYKTLPIDAAFAQVQSRLTADGSVLLRPGERDTLRYVKNDGGPELMPNVIQITVESLSADFVSPLNHASQLTPNLEALARHSLVFENFYATGTRTDRGMEALTLSLPPTPGRSMIKREHNEHMFTLGSVFRAKGYETAFIYGGFGYFDNMNHFFSQNGYKVVDRNSVDAADITFANVWGACDEDLYRWTMREADVAFAAGKPFHAFVMTTSNHRPFTFPEGRIDLPSKTSGRAGAVKYTDFAIGQFFREAAQKPWFKDTVFVIVADHCAASAGRAELPVQNYHIPLFIYSPGGHIAPGRIKALTSQVDFAPTLLGLLNWRYVSRFFGHDVRRVPSEATRALIGNYQKIGHLQGNHFVVLRPQRGANAYAVDLSTGALTFAPRDEASERAAVGYYQSANYLYVHGLYDALTPEALAQYAAEGERRATAPSVTRVAK